MLTIEPGLFCAMNWRAADFEQKNTPSRLIPTTARHPLGERFSDGVVMLAPWLLISTSRRPNWRTASATILSHWSASRTSTGVISHLPPALRISSRTRSRFSTLRLAIRTGAPAAANSLAIDSPIPVPPPVTMVTLPSTLNGFFTIQTPDRKSKKYIALIGSDSERERGVERRVHRFAEILRVQQLSLSMTEGEEP